MALKPVLMVSIRVSMREAMMRTKLLAILLPRRLVGSYRRRLKGLYLCYPPLTRRWFMM